MTRFGLSCDRSESKITPMDAEEQRRQATMRSATVYLPTGTSLEFRGEDVIAFDQKQIVLKAKGSGLTHYVGFPFVVELEPMQVVSIPPSGIIVPA